MKYIFIFVISISSFTVYSQSKSETENWIIEKFDKWKLGQNFQLEDFTRHYVDPKILSFSDCKLKLIVSTGTASYSSSDSYELNIGDIKNVIWESSILRITSRLKNITVTKRDNLSSPETWYVRDIEIRFDTDAENNLKIRLSKAFNHLKSFCIPSISPKEVF